ncbi:MAG: hypothetical protein M3Q75_00385 [Gemmatimonadota bacterium]|nr:hypothetical protein [Gemmatimonadota bacterium]
MLRWWKRVSRHLAPVRALGHTELAVATALRGYDAAQLLGDPGLAAFTAMQRAGALIRIGARHRAATVLGDGLVAVEPAADPTAADTRPAQAAGILSTWRLRSLHLVRVVPVTRTPTWSRPRSWQSAPASTTTSTSTSDQSPCALWGRRAGVKTVAGLPARRRRFLGT